MYKHAFYFFNAINEQAQIKKAPKLDAFGNMLMREAQLLIASAGISSALAFSVEAVFTKVISSTK